MSRRISASKVALMGFAQGFIADLLEGFKTERARKAKELEMQELRRMALEDRSQDHQWRAEDRAADVAARTSDREDQQAAQKEMFDLEGKQRMKQLGAEGSMRLTQLREEMKLRETSSANDRATQVEIAKLRTQDPDAVWQLPDGTLGQGPVSWKPAEAILKQLNGKNMYPPRAGEPGYVAPTASATGVPAYPGAPANNQPFDPNSFLKRYTGN